MGWKKTIQTTEVQKIMVLLQKSLNFCHILINGFAIYNSMNSIILKRSFSFMN